jgi:hypothetical protein
LKLQPIHSLLEMHCNHADWVKEDKKGEGY